MTSKRVLKYNAKWKDQHIPFSCCFGFLAWAGLSLFVVLISWFPSPPAKWFSSACSSNNDTRKKNQHVSIILLNAQELVIYLMTWWKQFNYAYVDDGLYALAIPCMFQLFHPWSHPCSLRVMINKMYLSKQHCVITIWMSDAKNDLTYIWIFGSQFC